MTVVGGVSGRSVSILIVNLVHRDAVRACGFESVFPGLHCRTGSENV